MADIVSGIVSLITDLGALPWLAVGAVLAGVGYLVGRLSKAGR
jgi:hypothetical protein